MDYAFGSLCTQDRKDKLVLSMAADRKQLSDIEDRVLALLSAADGNLLDDEASLLAPPSAVPTSTSTHPTPAHSLPNLARILSLAPPPSPPLTPGPLFCHAHPQRSS